MNETQRAAAERLADSLEWLLRNCADPDSYPMSMCKETAALLRELAAELVQAPDLVRDFPAVKAAKKAAEAELGYYREMMAAEPVQLMRCPEDGGECGAGGYCRPEQRKPLTPSMQAEVECDCLVAWNASTYGHSAQDTVHPMFLSAFISGYRAAERAHGITGEQK